MKIKCPSCRKFSYELESDYILDNIGVYIKCEHCGESFDLGKEDIYLPTIASNVIIPYTTIEADKNFFDRLDNIIQKGEYEIPKAAIGKIKCAYCCKFFNDTENVDLVETIGKCIKCEHCGEFFDLCEEDLYLEQIAFNGTTTYKMIFEEEGSDQASSKGLSEEQIIGGEKVHIGSQHSKKAQKNTGILYPILAIIVILFILVVWEVFAPYNISPDNLLSLPSFSMSKNSIILTIFIVPIVLFFVGTIIDLKTHNKTAKETEDAIISLTVAALILFFFIFLELYKMF